MKELFGFRCQSLLSSLILLALVCTAEAAAPPARPNIIIVLIDDLRWDEVGYPFVKLPNIQRIAHEGVQFRNAFVTTPLCSPSRASFLTGQYAHTHGITDNTDRSPHSHALVTFPRLLHDGGYESAFLGKWHMGLDDTARPGFDYWISVKGQGRYIDPVFNVNGKRQLFHGYFTDVLNQFVAEYLERPHPQPFVLFLAHKAIHPDLTQNADGSLSDVSASKFLPAERHKHLYADAPIPHRPNYARAPEDKPVLLRAVPGMPPLGPKTVTTDETIRDRLRVLSAVDEGVGQILAVLERQKQLDNTLIVFTSDEGYFYGEHGLSVERRLAYEESIRIPLFMRWPKLLKAGRSIDACVLNIDLAPTMLELAGLAVPASMQGRSLAPLLRDQSIPWRSSFLIEYYSDKVFPRASQMGYQAVRTDRWKYIHYTDLTGMDELYDLRDDPYEMRNAISEPSSGPVILQLQGELRTLLK